ncbi:NADP-dependent oxidoreductase [Weissella coleopterorum]|uniref:NADP-dependent oxidoreductase n=1 Tax=Weissella coleopterorum TaxID=2714949 RepID=A0A6G8B1X8_9LACO|nr:NADP-dependent oxidoreductase [Weissella coleopterorum]QIL51225.1 NADP-dependent oxidoreductase [Weissella coleopterorum]
MKAIQIEKFGDVDEMKMQTVGIPALGKKQILVQNNAVAIDPYDIKYVMGIYGPNDNWPIIPGSSVAGTVMELGSEAEGFKLGERVVATRHLKTYAELVPIGQSALAKIPTNVSDEVAVASALGAATGYQMIVDRLAIQAGERVLIHGGAGQVGAMAIQVALLRGAQVVATASPDDFEFVRSLGVQAVLDYHKIGWESLDAFDAILDPIGGQMTEKSVKVLKMHGRLKTLGAIPETLQSGADVEAVYADIKRPTLDALLALLADNQVQIRLGDILSFTEKNIQQAHLNGRQHSLHGKTILKFTD